MSQNKPLPMPIVGIINSWEEDGDQNLLHMMDDYRASSALNFRKTNCTGSDMWRRTSKIGFKRQSPMAMQRPIGEITDFCNTSIILKENTKDHLVSPLQPMERSATSHQKQAMKLKSQVLTMDKE